MSYAPVIKSLDIVPWLSFSRCQVDVSSVALFIKTKSFQTYSVYSTMQSPMKKRLKTHDTTGFENEMASKRSEYNSCVDSPCHSPENGLDTMYNRVLKIAVEGNIATGKSSFIDLLDHAKQEWAVVPEPVAKWTNVSTSCDQHSFTSSQQQGGNLLKLFYDDINRWAYTFQSYVLFRYVMHK